MTDPMIVEVMRRIRERGIIRHQVNAARISVPSVRDWERKRSPKIRNLRRILDTLNLDIEIVPSEQVCG